MLEAIINIFGKIIPFLEKAILVIASAKLAVLKKEKEQAEAENEVRRESTELDKTWDNMSDDERSKWM